MPFNGLAPYTLAKNRPVTPAVWTRPADWITITDDANKIQFLVSDQVSASVGIYSNFSRTSGSQNILIDWGDGTTDTVSATGLTTTNHTFTTGGTPSTQGYNTWLVTVTFTGSGTSSMTRLQISPPSTLNGVTPLLGSMIPVLEAYYGDTIAASIATFGNYFITGGNPAYNARLLKYVKFPATSASTTFQNCFNGAAGLARVVMPTSASSATNFNGFATGAVQLESCDLSGCSTGITDLTSAFSGCSNLTSVKLPAALDSCTTLASAFLNCRSLTNITLPSLNACITWTSTFSGCTDLLWCRITSFATSGTINLTSTWSGCTSMQWCWWPTTVTPGLAWTTTSTFATCYALQSFTVPENWNGTTLAFDNCYGLTNINFPTTSMSNLTSLSFSGCSNLQEISLPTTVASGITLNFGSCTALSSITIPSGWTLGSLASTFSGCTSLGSATLPNNTQNSITSFASTFSGCTNLQTVVLPTVTSSATTFASAFLNCSSLKSVALPDLTTNIAGVTCTSMFSGCSSLQSVTFLGKFGATNGGIIGTAIFQNCTSLKTITFPTDTTISTGVSSSMFSGCTSLQSVTLPTATAANNTNTLTSLFAACPALTTINNLSALGSNLTTGLLINCTTFMTGGTAQVTSLSFPQRITKLELQGTATNRSRLSSLRLTNTGGSQWTGTSPQISVAYTDMSTANLVTLFNDLAAQGSVTSKTIDITSATGAAGLTAGNRQIITNIGWTITG